MSARTLQSAVRRFCRSLPHGIPRICSRTARLATPLSLRCEALQRRHMSTPPPMVKHSELSVERYHELSDITMDTLVESLENLLDEIADSSYEVEYSSGVLTLKLGKKGTYVINKQPPNKQIWLSSPLSGPKRYDYLESKDGWYYSRDGRSIGDLLETELGGVIGQGVHLGLDNISRRVD